MATAAQSCRAQADTLWHKRKHEVEAMNREREESLDTLGRGCGTVICVVVVLVISLAIIWWQWMY